MTTTFPGETDAYRRARNDLLVQETELRRAVEAVAALRRALPPGGPVPQDYEFEQLDANGTPSPVRLSELFAPGRDTLVVYNFMYGPEMDQPCDGCTLLLDPLDRAADWVGQRVNLVVAAASPLPRILAYAKERDWRHLHLLSSAGTTYNADYPGEHEGHQQPMLNVFRRTATRSGISGVPNCSTSPATPASTCVMRTCSVRRGTCSTARPTGGGRSTPGSTSPSCEPAAITSFRCFRVFSLDYPRRGCVGSHTCSTAVR